jgi:hypothetical protein
MSVRVAAVGAAEAAVASAREARPAGPREALDRMEAAGPAARPDCPAVQELAVALS